MNDRNLALKISKHPLIRRLLETKMATSSIVARLIVEELMNEDETNKLFLSGIINDIMDEDSYKEAKQNIENTKAIMNITEEEYQELLKQLEEKERELQAKAKQGTEDDDIDDAIDPDAVAAAEKELSQKADPEEPSKQEEPQAPPQPDEEGYEIDENNAKSLIAAIDALLNDFYTKKYKIQQAKILETLIDVLANIAEDSGQELAYGKIQSEPTPSEETKAEGMLRENVGEMSKALRLSFKTLLYLINKTKKALAAFLETAKRGSVLTSSVKQKFMDLLAQLQKSIKNVISNVEELKQAARPKNEVISEAEEDEIVAKWKEVQRVYDVAEKANLALKLLVTGGEQKKITSDIINNAYSSAVRLSQYFPSLNPFNKGAQTKSDMQQYKDKFNAAIADVKNALQLVVNLGETGIFKSNLDTISNSLQDFSTSITEIFHVAGVEGSVDKNQFATKGKSKKKGEKQDTSVKDPEAKKDPNEEPTSDEMFAEFQTVATKLFGTVELDTYDMKVLYKFYNFMKGSEIKANLQEDILDKLGAVGYEEVKIKKFFGTLDIDELKAFKDIVNKLQKNNLLDKLPELITLKIRDTGKKPQDDQPKPFDIEDLYAVLEKHKDTYEKAKKLIETSSLNEDKRLANLKKVEDEFDRQAYDLSSMFGVLDSLDSQSKKTVVNAAQTFVNMYDELTQAYNIMKDKKLGTKVSDKLANVFGKIEGDLDQIKKDLEPIIRDLPRKQPKRKQSLTSIRMKVLKILPVGAYKVLSGGTTEYYDTFIKFVLYIKSLLAKKTNEELESKIATDSGIDKEIIKQALEQINQKSPQFFNDIKEMFETELQQKRAAAMFEVIKEEGGFDALPEYEGDFFGDEFQGYKFGRIKSAGKPKTGVKLPEITQALEDAKVDLTPYDVQEITNSIKKATKKLSQKQGTEDMAPEEKIEQIVDMAMSTEDFMSLSFDTGEQKEIENTLMSAAGDINLFDKEEPQDEESKKDNREPVDEGVFDQAFKNAKEEMKETFTGATNMNVLLIIEFAARVSRSKEEAQKVAELAEEYINGDDIYNVLSSYLEIREDNLELKHFKNLKLNNNLSGELELIVKIIQYLRVDLEELKPTEEIEEQIANKLKPLIKEQLRRNR